MLPQLRAGLLSRWPESRLGCPRPSELGLLVQGTGVGKLCCYLFPDNASEPRWVAKVPRTPADNARLIRENGLVQFLRERGSNFVRATIPGPLWVTAIAGHYVSIEPYLRGSPIDDLLAKSTGQNQWSIQQCLDTTLEWLLRSQLEIGARPEPLTDAQVRRYLLAPIGELRATARLTLTETAFLERVEARVRELASYPLPLVFHHGDFQPANIRVIDWEFGAPLALPLLDAFGLLTRTYASLHALEEIDGFLEDYLRAFEAVFLDGGPFATRSADCVGRACKALEVAPDWVPLLFVLFLVIEANKYHAFLRGRAERGYVYLLRSRDGQTKGAFTEQLARQKYVWLLGYLASQEERLVFKSNLSGAQPAVGSAFAAPFD